MTSSICALNTGHGGGRGRYGSIFCRASFQWFLQLSSGLQVREYNMKTDVELLKGGSLRAANDRVRVWPGLANKAGRL